MSPRENSQTAIELMTSVLSRQKFFCETRKGVEMKKLSMLKKAQETVLLVLASLLIGGIVGSLDALFGITLLKITAFRENHFVYLIPFLAFVGMLFVYLFNRYGKNAVKGMSLIFQVGHGEEERIPKRLIPFIISGTWLTHLFGGSAGREGVAVQLGATVANWFGRVLRLEEKTRLFLVTGMAAGFGGLFETPIAATFFAMEVLVVGTLRYDALLTSLIAAFSASYVSKSLGLEKFSVPLHVDISLDGTLLFKLIVLGIIFGIVGLLFTKTLEQCKAFLAERIKNPVLRIGIVGLILSIFLFLFFTGRYSGLGTNLINASFEGDYIASYDWLLKLIFTVVTISAGFQGGEVTPLFSIGASLGVILGTFMGLPVEFAAALGYASVFGSATNTFLAPVFIGGEVFGFEYLPYFLIVCSIAYMCNRNHSIYGLQKNASL